MKLNQALTDEQRSLVEQEYPIIRWTVRRYFDCHENIVGLSFDDLCQEGAIALCKAAVTYRNGPIKFRTYAVTVIRNHLLDHCRRILNVERNLPTLPLEQTGEDDIGVAAEVFLTSPDDIEDTCLTGICMRDFFLRRKQSYPGVAKLGVEALELKVLDGYSTTELASLYDAKLNLVGAWISKATQRIREDITVSELSSLGAENVPAKS